MSKHKLDKKKKKNYKTIVSQVIAVGFVGVFLLTPLAYIITDEGVKTDYNLNDYEVSRIDTVDFSILRDGKTKEECLDFILETMTTGEGSYSSYGDIQENEEQNSYIICFDNKDTFLFELTDNLILASLVEEINKETPSEETPSENIPSEETPNDVTNEEVDNEVTTDK